MDDHETLWCVGCGTEICWPPTILHGKVYCCRDCAVGLSCDCHLSMEWEDDRQEQGAADIPFQS